MWKHHFSPTRQPQELGPTDKENQHNALATLQDTGTKEQDKPKGKITTHWREAQAAYYQTIQSQKTSKTWASGLITHLLELTHSMWTTRNGIKHEWLNGLKKERAAEVERLIREEFAEGPDSLLPCDHHLREKGLDNVLQLDGIGQVAWLDAMEAAQVSYMENRNAELQQMRLLLRNWLQSENN